ncbi:M23 family metallopeptidase [Streptomyces sp. NPDC005840]|jgi:murein DD-endopeptidase MepM/ murein hydrolase activator NlpD|uniref:M23 family metallopeptidase n=1 Tax=Streptomyces doudnae TaxID=3075536 RepID=A0ABD5F0N2_9ACTN|nr:MULTISPECIES: M23 family metallopeptidase [unclassified Streptomyces]MDT0439814.1 M23 family metallopeptidase [Streptomyces sp. DSM 41981]MYQ66990.1 peptidoglycan DD-metalloendopeptidase family protein [Streptomyces sp. SID4950]SCE28406.1 Murein DD-endopeptidase MepM and murein hydrolase activator NlpD, contain LysM domain [Streptomyces sp. SolWspMP-5a-2]
MSSRVSSRSTRTSTLRARATVLAAGLGVSVALGAGVAVAADTTAASHTTANAVAAQAAAQAKAAATKQSAAEKKAVQQAAVKKAAAKKAASWITPVKKYTLSASFAQAGGMWNSTHSGQDFAVATGTDVRAAHGGTVVKAGGNGAGDGPAYGNAVVIKHGNGTYSQYAHLSRIDVKPGQVVKTGQHIARSGNTGNSSGPHLHFEIRTTANYGSAVNPVAFLRTVGVRV